MLEKKCAHCQSCVVVSEGNGHCRKSPPTAVSTLESSFPLVHPDHGWCGEYKRHWRRWWAYKNPV